MASLLALLALTARAEFSITKPALEAEVTLEGDRSWHLGGFCFGKSEGEAARLVGSYQWQGPALSSEPAGAPAGVYLVWFDGREDKWGAARASWESSTCEEKIQLATGKWHLGDHPKFAIAVKQKMASRDWHFSLVTCGPLQGLMKFKLEADHGARSVFGSNENFDESSCPAMPSDWWQEASGESSFWTVLVVVSVFSCICAMALPLIRWCCTHCTKKKGASSPGASPDVVIGKPSVTYPQNMVAEGQPNNKADVEPNSKVGLEP